MSNRKVIAQYKKQCEEQDIVIRRLSQVVERLSEAIFGSQKNKGIGLVRAYDDIDTRSLALYRILEEKKTFTQEEFLKHVKTIQEEIAIAKEDAMYLQAGYQRKEPGTVAEKGDLLLVDLDSTIDGKGHPGDKQNGVHVVIGQDMPYKGFDENLIGVAEGKDVEFTVTPPDDFPVEEMRGKLVLYKVKVQSVRCPVKKAEEKPALEAPKIVSTKAAPKEDTKETK